MRRSATVVATVSAALLLSAARCSTSQLDEALEAARRVQGSSSVREVEEGGQLLKNLPTSELSTADQARRLEQLAALDAAIERSVAADADRGISTAGSDLPQYATDLSALVQPVDADQRFVADLQAVTEDQLKAAACDSLLNAFAPEQTPDPSSEGASKYVGKAIVDLGARWVLPPYLRSAYAWQDWGRGVVKDGQQVATAVEADPQAYVSFFSKPGVARGSIAYGRFCYATPGR